MLGTIIAVKQDQGYVDVYLDKEAATYRAPCADFASDPALVVGSDAEIEPESNPSFFSPGKAKLTAVKALNYANDKVGLAPTPHYPEHDTVRDERRFLIAAEGGSERECRSALIEKAIECKVNALLDLKLEVVTRPGVKTALFRYTARPALVNGPKYQAQQNQRMAIPTDRARRNSPNEAMVRYIRVLLISFLFVAIPCIMAMTKNGVLASPLIGQIITAGLLMLCMFLFLFISFKKRQSFVLSLKKINRD